MEIRILVPSRVAEALKRRAEREGLTVEELLLLALSRVLEEEVGK